MSGPPKILPAAYGARSAAIPGAKILTLDDPIANSQEVDAESVVETKLSAGIAISELEGASGGLLLEPKEGHLRSSWPLRRRHWLYCCMSLFHPVERVEVRLFYSPRFMCAQTTRTQDSKEMDECTARIRDQLKDLRSDEVASIAQTAVGQGSILDREIAWIKREVIGNSIVFMKYLASTWSNIFWGLLTGRYDISTFLCFLFFGAGASFVLSIVYAWCFVATTPIIVALYNITFGHMSGHLSLVNGMNPKIFKALQQNQCEVAKRKLSAAPSSVQNPREFDYDMAKFLLQLSSLMYERSTSGLQKALQSAGETLKSEGRLTSDTADTSDPGGLITSIFDTDAISKIKRLLRQDDDESSMSPISTFVNDYKICCEPLSELASTSHAYCSLFWDPSGNWVVAAFRGTDPTSFEEWMTDFNVIFTDASAHIPGFRCVHQGFKERLFPRDQERSPYDTIAAGIKVVTDELANGRPPGTKINVWFTGHSLGTAIASLAYSKALLSKDIGSNALLRDAYLFATPVVVDTVSRNALHKGLCDDPDVSRCMWRITNRNDFVATALPCLGDFKDVVPDPDNLINFCHLGVEIFLKSSPSPCQIQGHDRILPQSQLISVDVKSEFSDEENADMRRNASLHDLAVTKMFLAIQYIPFIGGLAAHATVNYWDQLDKMSLKGCVPKPREWWQ